MVTDDKEVYFDQWCKSCEYEDKSESDDPCWDCLADPVNYHSHKPVKWEEKKSKRA